jgi:hypothetical protein
MAKTPWDNTKRFNVTVTRNVNGKIKVKTYKNQTDEEMNAWEGMAHIDKTIVRVDSRQTK